MATGWSKGRGPGHRRRRCDRHSAASSAGWAFLLKDSPSCPQEALSRQVVQVGTLLLRTTAAVRSANKKYSCSWTSLCLRKVDLLRRNLETKLATESSSLVPSQNTTQLDEESDTARSLTPEKKPGGFCLVHMLRATRTCKAIQDVEHPGRHLLIFVQPWAREKCYPASESTRRALQPLRLNPGIYTYPYHPPYSSCAFT